MAVGDLIVSDYQYEYNNGLFGAKTIYVMQQVTGLLGSPEVNDNDTDRQDAHGQWPAAAYTTARTVEFDVAVDGASQVAAENALEALNSYFALSQVFRQFVFQRPGKGKRYVNAQVRRRDFDSTYELAHGLLTGSVRLYCADPRIYALNAVNVDYTIPIGQSNVAHTINQLGNADAGATIVITGPASNINILNLDDGTRQIKINVTLTPTDILTIDVQHRAVLLNGVDRYDLVRSDSQWWHLVPGNNRITYSRTDSGAASTMTLTYKDTWL